MEFSERDLEDWFFKNPNMFAETTDCACGDFYWVGRQIQVPSGIIDLLGICGCRSHYPTVYVVELKAEKLRSSAIGQVVRYSHDIGQAMEVAAEDGIYLLSKWCIGVGRIDDAVQYEANAVGVSLITVEPTFAVRGPWGWTETRESEDEKQTTHLGKSLIEHVKNVCVPMEKMRLMAEGKDEVTNS